MSLSLNLGLLLLVGLVGGSDLGELESRVSTFVNIHHNDPTAWLRECAYHVKKAGYGTQLPVGAPGVLADYYVIEQPSGMCTMQLNSAFESLAWNYTLEDVFNKYDLLKIGFDEIKNELPSTKFPALMSFPQTVKDVVEIVRYAKVHGMKVSVKNSGHNYVGQTDVKDSFQMNLRNFPKYSYTEIYECEGTDTQPLSGPPCKLALDRKKTAVVRVGGGEGNDDIYRAVNDWNYKEERNRTYQVFGGAEGAIGAGGGWMMGGGLGMGATDRLWGIGIDQVLELEMVLPDGSHVKFGPTAWEKVDGYLYPQTLTVEGRCNKNVQHHESKWVWGECDKPIPFEELWSAVRGGGGGTWGVVISAYHQLHEDLPTNVITTNEEAVSKIKEECAKLATCSLKDAGKMWLDFIIDYLFNPGAIGVDKSKSNACGATGNTVFGNPFESTPPTGFLLFCMGDSPAEQFLKAWREYVPSSKYLPDGLDSQLLNDVLFSCPVIGGSWPRIAYIPPTFGLPIVNGHVNICANVPSKPSEAIQVRSPIGRLNSGTSFGAYTEYSFNAMLPIKWIVNKTNQEEIFEILPYCSANHMLGGNVQVSSDGKDSIAEGVRNSFYGCPVGLGFLGSKTYTELEKAISRIQSIMLPYMDIKDGQFPGWSDLNHVFPYAGPLKSDWNTACPLSFEKTERREKCMSAQEAIWGTKNLAKLEAIKTKIDPDNTFSVFFGINNAEVVGPVQPLKKQKEGRQGKEWCALSTKGLTLI